jgi:hypothetical protein
VIQQPVSAIFLKMIADTDGDDRGY